MHNETEHSNIPEHKPEKLSSFGRLIHLRTKDSIQQVWFDQRVVNALFQ